MSKTSGNYTNRKILVILSFIFAITILVCFLSGLIGLIIEPSNVFVVENRNNIPRGKYIWIYSKRRESSLWRKLSKWIG